jgi:hypothetical protein
MGIFMVYIIWQKIFFISNCTRYLVSSIIEKVVEMDFMCWPNSQCFSPFISKWLFIKISIYHIILVNALKNPICEVKMIKLLTWFKICGIACEINIINFVKVKNNSNVFGVYLHFSIHITCICFIQIYSNAPWYK